jgi:hypothetical protein
MTDIIPTEYAEQVAFVQWLRLKCIPHWRTPNETYTTSYKQKATNKALGVSAGVPDLFVVLPYSCIIGIEMKRRSKSVTSEAQKQWIETLNTVPNVQAYVCKGADEAIAVVERLMGKSLAVEVSDGLEF